MYWQKKGLIFKPEGNLSWNKYGFMTPHAKLMGDIIRVWGGIRDDNGVSRIACVDLEADDPAHILKVYEEPALDIGEPGTFDDNGVILGDIIEDRGSLRLYYVGFQHVQKAKFYAFSGLAISNDGGLHFNRYSKVPVMDRTDSGRFGRCIHTVLKEENVYKIYYAIINDWKIINNIPYPVYDIWMTESQDGIHIPDVDDTLCITTNENEYRIERPKVYKTNCGYEMYYTRDFIPKDYIIGYATSKDGFKWTRDDENCLGMLRKSDFGWDSQMACYPVILQYKDRTYAFYNGNDMGGSGFGYAELIDK